MRQAVFLVITALMLMMFCAGKLFALSSDDFIVQRAISHDRFFRPKIYLSQIWGEAQIDDRLLKTETHEQWSGYRDVIIYFYENIEIVTATVFPNAPYRWIVDIAIIGNGFHMKSDITVGHTRDDIIVFYGNPLYELSSDGITYINYQINDPRADYGYNLVRLSLTFTLKDNVITRIRVNYIYNI